eukprot:scaffold25620_cov99-Isochrysis_galbana.AAC.7
MTVPLCICGSTTTSPTLMRLCSRSFNIMMLTFVGLLGLLVSYRPRSDARYEGSRRPFVSIPPSVLELR